MQLKKVEKKISICTESFVSKLLHSNIINLKNKIIFSEMYIINRLV